MAENSGPFSEFADQGVLITGGGSGIGASLVTTFAEQGAKVAFIDINVSASQNLVETLSRKTRHPVTFIEADLRDQSRLANYGQRL